MVSPSPSNRTSIMASRITIKNEFTGSTTTVDPSRPLTRQKIRAIRRRLCRPECTSGDLLGARGPQADAEAYERFHDRAIDVFSGKIVEFTS